MLPVLLTGVGVEEQAHLPSLIPYRAKVQVSLQVVEGDNPFLRAEAVRRRASAAIAAVGGARALPGTAGPQALLGVGMPGGGL